METAEDEDKDAEVVAVE